jgi:hypothetical protein
MPSVVVSPELALTRVASGEIDVAEVKQRSPSASPVSERGTSSPRTSSPRTSSPPRLMGGSAPELREQDTEPRELASGEDLVIDPDLHHQDTGEVIAPPDRDDWTSPYPMEQAGQRGSRVGLVLFIVLLTAVAIAVVVVVANMGEWPW